jgi:hypothetical protein
MMDTDIHCTADAANDSHDATSESSSPPLATPSPPACVAPPAHVLTTPANTDTAGRQPRSEAWNHFAKALDYMASRKATCMHCSKTLMVTHGSTTTMLAHLKTKHPNMLTTSADAKSLGR